MYFSVLQCHTILEDGNFTVAVYFVAGLLTAGNSDDLVDESVAYRAHVLSNKELPGIEVYPVWLACRKVVVRRNLHRGDESAERRSTARGEGNNLTAR